MSVLFNLGKSTTSGSFGVECIQPSLDISGKLCLSFSYLNSSASVQFSCRTCHQSIQTFEHVTSQFRLLILVAPCRIEAPWLPTVLHMFEDNPKHCSVIKGLIIDTLIGQVLKGLPYQHLPFCLFWDICYADKGSLPQYVRQWQGLLKNLQQKSTSNVGKNGKVAMFEEVYQTLPYLLLHYLILVPLWFGIHLVFTILLFQFF